MHLELAIEMCKWKIMRSTREELTREDFGILVEEQREKENEY